MVWPVELMTLLRNNMRMGIESLMVVAHATGRMLVLPPQDNIYLIDKKFKDPEDPEAHRQMGVQDFYSLALLRSQRGFHVMTMRRFLKREALKGRLKGKLPPRSSFDVWGKELWEYLKEVADVTPEWFDKVVAFPERPGDFLLQSHSDEDLERRLKRFRYAFEWNMLRDVVYYDEVLPPTLLMALMNHPSRGFRTRLTFTSREEDPTESSSTTTVCILVALVREMIYVLQPSRFSRVDRWPLSTR